MRQEGSEVTFFGFNITQFKSEIWKFIEFYAHTLAILVVDFFFLRRRSSRARRKFLRKVCGFKSPAKSMKYDGITSLRSGVSQSFIFRLMFRVSHFFSLRLVMNFRYIRWGGGSGSFVTNILFSLRTRDDNCCSRDDNCDKIIKNSFKMSNKFFLWRSNQTDPKFFQSGSRRWRL